VAILLPKLLPLALDGSSSVRTQLLQFLRQLPPKEVSDRTEAALLYIRAGMTHLAVQIRNDALGLMEWLLDASSEAVVSCSGGWVKTLKAFLSMMGWAESSTSTSWTSAAKTSLAKGGASFPRQMLVFAKFLEVGLGNLMSDSPYQNGRFYPLWDSEVHRVASTSSPYAHLNLFGQMRDEENEMYHERDSRQRVFSQRFQSSITKGIDNAKKEGGEIGRAAAFLEKTVKKSMEDYESLDMDTLE
jgi:pre-rRNA-processing protein IPI1